MPAQKGLELVRLRTWGLEPHRATTLLQQNHEHEVGVSEKGVYLPHSHFHREHVEKMMIHLWS
jgi:hypothetical protein